MDIELSGLSKKFGQYEALAPTDLTLVAGKIYGLAGLNGAGKSTLLRLIYGLLAPTTGSVSFNRQPFQRSNVELRKKLFFLPDIPLTYPNFSVIRHLGMVLKVYDKLGDGIEQKVYDLLEECDLTAHFKSPMGSLSRGQLYKVCLIAMIAVDPQVWLFDEPFASGMDPQGFDLLNSVCRKATGAGKTVVFSTQIIEVTHGFADEILVIHKGHCVFNDALETLETSNAIERRNLDILFQKLKQP
jgi:ABC-type multidrug transport system ATPase subunit